MKNLILILITTLSLVGCKFEKQYIKESREMWMAYFHKVLKDPNSLVIYEEKCNDIGIDVVEWEIEYGAKNGFGGMVRETEKFKTIGDLLLVGEYGTYKKEDIGLK